jgi:hypothetical protein
MSQRWRTLQRVMLRPGMIGVVARAVLVLARFEYKMIKLKAAEAWVPQM